MEKVDECGMKIGNISWAARDGGNQWEKVKYGQVRGQDEAVQTFEVENSFRADEEKNMGSKRQGT